MTAIITGSFDPITLGHENLIRRASAMFDTVYIAVCGNSSKVGCFTPDERLALVKAACDEMHLDNLRPICSEGLLADTCKELGATVIVRGVRCVTDFDYETSLSRINSTLNPGLETILLICDPNLSHISSNVVREMIRYHRDLHPFVSSAVADQIEQILASRG